MSFIFCFFLVFSSLLGLVLIYLPPLWYDHLNRTLHRTLCNWHWHQCEGGTRKFQLRQLHRRRKEPEKSILRHLRQLGQTNKKGHKRFGLLFGAAAPETPVINDAPRCRRAENGAAIGDGGASGASGEWAQSSLPQHLTVR